MVHYRCDGCGREMGAKELRYSVHIEVKAAYEEMEVSLLDLVRDHREEMRKLIAQMGEHQAGELESQIYKKLCLDLCPGCHRAFLHNPLRFHPEQTGEGSPVDVDALLRSLGYGGPQE